MKEYIKQFFYLLDTPAKKTAPLLIVVFLLSSLLDVVGIGLIGVFLVLLTNPQFFLQKFPHLAFFLQGWTEKELVIFAGLLIMSAFIVKAVITLAIQKWTVYFSQALSIRLKLRLMTAYQHAPYTYYLKKNSADFISIIQINLGSYISGVLLATLNLISSLIIAICILLFLLIVHPLSTAFLIAMFSFVGWGFDFYTKRKLSKMGKMVAELSGGIIKDIHHALYGLIETRVLGRENYFLNALNKKSIQYASGTSVLTVLQQTPRYLIENIIAIFIIGLSLGGIIVGYKAENIVSMVGMFAVAGARLLPTVNQIIVAISEIRGSYSNMSLLYNDLAELDALTKLSKSKLVFNQEGQLHFSTICLRDVCYKYPHTSQSALNNVEMIISKGQSIGLVGPSGAGKSTLVNLILGFLEPQQGQLLIDGEPIQSLRAWLNNFAYISQTIFLLDDTLRRNIAFGIEDKDIDDMRIWKAIKMAQLTEVVQQLPNGLDTLIGENGARLSGGQRQRVALARAFYHERDVIIMDEATSSLDHETEKEVINTIKQLRGNKTLIVIAHRLTTVEHCDVLYRLEQGRISAVGSFKEVVGGMDT